MKLILNSSNIFIRPYYTSEQPSAHIPICFSTSRRESSAAEKDADINSDSYSSPIIYCQIYHYDSYLYYEYSNRKWCCKMPVLILRYNRGDITYYIFTSDLFKTLKAAKGRSPNGLRPFWFRTCLQFLRFIYIFFTG